MLQPHIIVITGPTASGKTDFALKLAENLCHSGQRAEIINADSIQIYKDLTILTAKPTEQDMKRVKHHLFGMFDADIKFSVNDWKILTEQTIDNLLKSNIIPIICGGTGFYIDALVNGISTIPNIPESHRKYVFEIFQKYGRNLFFEKLKKIDPEICIKLHPNNTQRILRAYEVATFTGQPLTYWWKQKEKPKYNFDINIILLPKIKLYQRIMFRIQKMIEIGAVSEVAEFLQKYQNYNGALSKVIGLNEITSFLNKQISHEKMIELMYIKTKQYAKRQITWFRNKMLYANKVMYDLKYDNKSI